VLSGLGLALLVGAGVRALAEGRRGPVRLLLGLLLAVTLPVGMSLLRPDAGVEAWFAGQRTGEVVGAAAREATATALLRLAAASAVGLLGTTLACRLPRRRSAALLLGALAIDLGLTVGPTLRFSDPVLLEPPPLAERLSAPATTDGTGAPPPRWFSRGRLAVPLEGDGVHGRQETQDLLARVVLEGSRAMPFHVRAVDAFETVHAAAFDRLARDPRLAALPAPERWARLDAELLPASEAELAAYPAFVAGPELAPGLFAAANRACPPWAYVVRQARRVHDLDAAIEQTCDPARAPREVVVLGPEVAQRDRPAPASVDGGAPGEPAGSVLSASFAPTRLSIRARSARGGWLVLREAWSDEWRAQLDGAPAPIERADVLFRAIAFPPGEHVVDMVYAPSWWAPGVILSLVGWAGILAALLLRRGRSTPRDQA
jgi:hypothetical protein